jgi:hypothetical protein
MRLNGRWCGGATRPDWRCYSRTWCGLQQYPESLRLDQPSEEQKTHHAVLRTVLAGHWSESAIVHGLQRPLLHGRWQAMRSIHHHRCIQPLFYSLPDCVTHGPEPSPSDLRSGHELQVWMLENLREDLTVDDRLAKKIGMSSRHFTRVCLKETQSAPS